MCKYQKKNQTQTRARIKDKEMSKFEYVTGELKMHIAYGRNMKEKTKINHKWRRDEMWTRVRN